MFRNPEIQRLIILLAVVSVVAISVTAIAVTPLAAVCVLITAGTLVACFLVFTKWRYKEIAKLSSYLRRISHGDYTLDVRDNYEGELSILKSDIYKVTLMLSEQSSLLQEDQKKLTEAISDISHQLKTPLTSMMVMADLLQNPNLNAEKRVEFTNNITIQLERIEWLVSSLLKLSRIDAGTVEFKKDQVIVTDLIQKALQPVFIPMDVKQQTLKISGDETVSFLGDRNWTAEALINILKNCVEHTAEKGVISISFSENALYTEINIKDNGIGILKEDLPYIFKRFYKGKQAGEDSVGIGLAMAYSIIKSQKGDIEVKSARERGTEFQIKFYKSVI
ncbi:sensor histidine kinase [Halalkalibacter okhensis]|uniref:histidine kinase n=1 Tax=Halalkalibacter okhensis TaxID=333138 RepID=A0A0B0IHT6_9BACI|nr:HAMP domain-containing sensor histidine kinase [Halalkalibacter okhensis]KHF39231.1 histidine kinase [Halalkalibacter okhensis]